MPQYLPQVSFQPYIKPYVGNSNQELGDTVKVLTQRYDENLKASTDLDILAGLTAAQVPEGDRKSIEGTIGTVRNSLKDISDSTNGYYAARPQISQLASKFAGDPDIAKMKENKKIMDESDRIRNEMRAKGMKVLDFSNGKQFQTVGTDEDGNKTYNTYAPQDEMQHNYHDAQMKFFDQLQADGSSGGLSHAAMAGFLQTSSWQGISGAKIKNQANRALSGYLGTTEGDQQFRKLTQIQGMSAQQANQTILKEMIGTGMERQSSVSSTSYQQDPYAIIAARKGTGKESAPDGYDLQRDPTLELKNNDNVSKVSDYLKGNLKSNITPIGAFFGSTNAGKSKGEINGYTQLNGEQKDMLHNALVQAKAIVGSTASKQKMMDTALSIIGGFKDNRMGAAYHSITGSTEISAANNEFRNGNYSSLMYQIADEPGKTYTWSEIKNKLGEGKTKDDDFLKEVSVSGRYAAGHVYTDGMTGEMKNRFLKPDRLSVGLANGDTKTIVASSSLGTAKSADIGYQGFKQDVFRGSSNGRGKVVRIGSDKYYVSPSSFEDPNNKEEEFGTITNENGQQRTVNLLDLYQSTKK